MNTKPRCRKKAWPLYGYGIHIHILLPAVGGGGEEGDYHRSRVARRAMRS
jgi:hypothetical protein